MKLEYIKAGGEHFEATAKGIQDPSKIDGVCLNVCYIKKLWFGRWQIDYFSDTYIDWEVGVTMYSGNQKPNTRLVLYPSGIQEIRYLTNN